MLQLAPTFLQRAAILFPVISLRDTADTVMIFLVYVQKLGTSFFFFCLLRQYISCLARHCLIDLIWALAQNKHIKMCSTQLTNARCECLQGFFVYFNKRSY